MARISTPFLPEQNGFRFVNSFDLTQLKIPLVKTFHPSRLIIGLCGGMCYAALDYYYAHQQIPTDHITDAIRPDFRSYLYRRQEQSLTPLVLLRLLDWMTHDDDYVGRLTVGTERVRLVSLLNAGLPAVLCLVRTRGLIDPTGNHQVVATGYDVDEASQQTTIYLYDPNHPGETPSLCLPSDWQPGAKMTQSSGEPLRGFFVMPYRPWAVQS